MIEAENQKPLLKVGKLALIWALTRLFLLDWRYKVIDSQSFFVFSHDTDELLYKNANCPTEVYVQSHFSWNGIPTYRPRSSCWSLISSGWQCWNCAYTPIYRDHQRESICPSYNQIGTLSLRDQCYSNASSLPQSSITDLNKDIAYPQSMRYIKTCWINMHPHE